MRIDHVGIAVESLETAVPVFEKILGRGPDSQEIVADQKVRVAVFNLEGGQVELLEATSPDSPIARFLAKRGQGIHHMTLAVPRIADKLRDLEEGGIRLIDPEARVGAGGKHVAFLHPSTTAGILVELVEEKEK